MGVKPFVMKSFHPHANTLKGVVYDITPPPDGQDDWTASIILGTDTTHPALSIKATDYELPDVFVRDCTNGMAHRALVLSTADLPTGGIYMQVQYFDEDGRQISNVDTAACSIVGQTAEVLEQVTREAMKGMLH